jgi:hypothetical protein
MGLMPAHGLRFPGLSAVGTSSSAVTAAVALQLGEATITDPQWAGGADKTGVVDIKTALAAAIAGASHIIFPPGSYKLTPGTIINKSCIIEFKPGASINGIFSASGTEKLISITAGGVLFINPTINGSFSPATVSANKYCFFVSGTISDVEIRNPNIHDFTSSDGNVGLTNLLVVHAIYFSGNVTKPKVAGGYIGRISGSAIFNSGTRGLVIDGVMIEDTKWYSIHLESDNQDWAIKNGSITAPTFTDARHWGGSINDMNIAFGAGDALHNVRGVIDNMVITGPHNYGAAIRLLSSRYVIVTRCRIHDVVGGTIAAGPVQLIGVDVRNLTTGGDGGDNGPPSYITIADNELYAGEPNGQAIYIKNIGARGRAPGRAIFVQRNKIYSTDETNFFFQWAIALHGLSAGFDGFEIADNFCQVKTISNTPSGGISVLSTNGQPGAMVSGKVNNNIVEQITSARPANSYEVGICFNAGWLQHIECRGNKLKRFHYGVRVVTSLIHRLYGFTDQLFEDCNNLMLFAAQPDRVSGSESWGAADPTEGVYQVGHRVRSPSPASAATPGRYCVTAGGGSATTTAWTNAEVIDITASPIPVQRQNASHRHYVALTSGTCATQPSGTTVGATEGGAAGDVLWLCVSTVSAAWKTEGVLS